MNKLALFGGKPIISDEKPHVWPIVTEKMEDYLITTLRSERLGYSENSVTREFEEIFARYHGCHYAIATNSGTSALLLAYFACGIGSFDGSESDEVIVPAYGFFATASPLLYLGAKPVFCDVEPETGNIDATKIANLITPKTKAIAVTHIAGHPANMAAILEIARLYGLKVIEDCSHAHGSCLSNQLVGTFGDIAAFSFQTGKIISSGEGGIVLTNDKSHLLRISALANFRRLEGLPEEIPSFLEETGLGLKLRLSPLSASLALYHLDELEELIQKRSERLNYLTQGINAIEDKVFMPPITKANVTRRSFYEYPIRCLAVEQKRLPLSMIKAALKAEGLVIRHSNTKAIHHLPLLMMTLPEAYAQLDNFSETKFTHKNNLSMPEADRLTQISLTLPTFTTEPFALIDKYIQAIEKINRHLPLLEKVCE